ncbi:amidase signature domain-containing protein [Lactarius quietus]|nr:amidase signature domain-containing protein [Lactarius quietus]
MLRKNAAVQPGNCVSYNAAYRETIESKRARRADALSHAPAFSEDTHQKYLDATAKQIVENIHAGVWTAAAVLEGYLARAAQAQEATNCLTEVFFEPAREEARKLDAEFAKTGELKGLLHGVPISVKDMIDVKGFDSSIGYTQWTNKPPSKTRLCLVAALRAAGAIVIAKTNSSNPIWGRTLNPWSAAHTAGGSSGGEGALLGADGAVLGVGTDIGGSIRIPSGYCGIYGFKPGHGRISYGGMAGKFLPRFRSHPRCGGSDGPLGADLERMARVLFGAHGGGHAYFPTPIPYRDVKLPEKLRFGYYLNVLESVQALRAAGHECVEIDCQMCQSGAVVFLRLTSADGYETIMSPLVSQIDGARQEPALFLTTLGTRLPGFVRAAASWVIRTIVGDAKFASIFTQSYKKTVRQLYECVVDKTAFEEQTRANLWSGRLDAIIAPVQASPAVPHGGCDRLAPIACSTLLYNIVESPVGVIPVTRVDATRDVLSDEWRAAPGTAQSSLRTRLCRSSESVGGGEVARSHACFDAALGPRGFGPGTWAPNKQTDVAKNMSDNQQ